MKKKTEVNCLRKAEREVLRRKSKSVVYSFNSLLFVIPGIKESKEYENRESISTTTTAWKSTDRFMRSLVCRMTPTSKDRKKRLFDAAVLPLQKSENIIPWHLTAWKGATHSKFILLLLDMCGSINFYFEYKNQQELKVLLPLFPSEKAYPIQSIETCSILVTSFQSFLLHCRLTSLLSSSVLRSNTFPAKQPPIKR